MTTFYNKNISWENIIEEGVNHNKIIVSGCQRSGTSLAAKALSEALSYKHYDESDFNFWNQKKFHLIFSKEEKSVIQAPALLHILPHYQDKALVVIMERNIEEVVKSMLRVGWYSRYGEQEYRNFTQEILTGPEDIYRVKLKFSSFFKNVKLNYSELKKSSFFIEDRKNWKIKQTQH